MWKSYILLLIGLTFMLHAHVAEARRSGGGGRSSGHVRVKSYTTRSGKSVGAHKRTSGDHTKSNNWSAKGNVNPYTGKKGYKRTN